MLFHDKRLSGDGTISCARCHNLASRGMDSLPHSIGIADQEGSVNAPTVFNAVFNLAQFWDGRAATLKEQVDGSVTNPIEMGSTWPDVIRKLESDSDYPRLFRNIYADKINKDHVKDAIAAFEQTLVTVNSRFDQYLRGNSSAINHNEKRGYELFKSYGCSACHQGMNVGGNMFQLFGVMNHYLADKKNAIKADLGRFNVTGKDADKYTFKVPSLRLITHTAPISMMVAWQP